MPRFEADRFVDQLLGTAAIVYGLKDTRSPTFREVEWLGGEKARIAAFISAQTGGQYLSVTPLTYSEGLEHILEQLRFRYELGFVPEILDGKRHKLRVTLTGTGENQRKGVQLKYRAAFFAVHREIP